MQVDHWYWTDTAFAVRVDPQLSGQLDHDDVRLVVEPLGAALIQKSGFKFRAARVTMTMPQVPQSAVQLFQPGRSSDSVIVMPTYFTPSQSPPGWTAEVQRGFYRTDFPAGSDSFDIGRLAPGFTASAQFTGSDNCGQFALGESWNIKWASGNLFRVIWTEWHCSVSGTPPFVAVDYAVSVVVTGPRGVDPWTGRASASTIALPR